MPYGLQVFDAAGNVILDVSTRLTRFTGSLIISAGSTGSVVVANAAQGNVWYYLFLPLTNNFYTPNITISGGTISWAPGSTFGWVATDIKMIYGVY